MTRRVDPARTQVTHQQVPTAEHVQRQIAVPIVVAVKEPVLLLAVQQRVRGVDIQNQVGPRRHRMRLHELVEQRLDVSLSPSPGLLAAPGGTTSTDSPVPPSGRSPSARPDRGATPRDRSSPHVPEPGHTRAA